MEKVDYLEIWRQIPPEEKFDMMARAQSKGLSGCLLTFLIASTLAVSLQLSWIMWASLVLSPFIFQFGAGKAWRGLRPMVVLEYLAARAAARRYAFAANSKDLQLACILRARMERQFDGDEGERVTKELEATIEHNRESSVWVALFNDAVVLMSEKAGGAKLEFAHLLNDKLEVEGVSRDDKGDYSLEREVYLSYSDRKNSAAQKVKLSSDYAAALIVFEKKLLALRRLNQEKAALVEEALPVLDAPDSHAGF